MNIETGSKWQIRLATLSIFLLGFLAGAFALNAYHLWFGSAARQQQQQQTTKRERYEEVFNKLGLSAEQKAEVQKTVGETREKLQRLRQESEPRVQEIRARHDENLQRVLTAEQWQKFQMEREQIRQTEKQDAP